MTRGQLVFECALALGLDYETVSGNELILMQRWHNRGVVDVLLKTHCYVDIGTMALQAGVTDYRIDSSILTVDNITLPDSSGAPYALDVVSMSDLIPYLDPSIAATVTPTKAAIEGTLLRVAPSPSSAITLTYIYVPKPTEIPADGTTGSDALDPSTAQYGGIPTEFHDAILTYMMWKGAEYDQPRNFDQGFVSDVARDELGPAQAYRMRTTSRSLTLRCASAAAGATARPTSGLARRHGGQRGVSRLPAVRRDGHAHRDLERGEHLPTQAVRRRRRRARHRHGRHDDRPVVAGLLAQHRDEELRHHPRRPLRRRARCRSGTTTRPACSRTSRRRSAAHRRSRASGTRGATTSCSATTTTRRVRPRCSTTGSRSAPSATRTRGRSPARAPRRSTSPRRSSPGLPLLNTTLVWGYNTVYSLTGDTPPPGGNLARKPLFQKNGTFDGRTVVPWRSYAIWANATGVFSSDGATFTDLTEAGGISNYYRSLVSGFAFTQGWSAVASILADRYVLTIRNAAGTVVTTLVCDLNRKVWTEWTNIQAGTSRSARPARARLSSEAARSGQRGLVYRVLSKPEDFPEEFTSWLPRWLAQNSNFQITAIQLPTVEKRRLVGATQEAQFAHGWVNFNAANEPAHYYKDAFGRVYVGGEIKSGTIGQSAFTLPAGYRPQEQIVMATASNDLFGEVVINTDGTVVPNVGSNVSFSLSGISFRQFA
jgi:hypothetical protein